MKLLLTFFLILTISACSSPESNNQGSVVNASDLLKFVSEKTFKGISSSSEDPYFTFHSSGIFELNLKSKRSGETRVFKGIYKSSVAKYEDSGDNYCYLKLSFDDHSYTDLMFLVFNDGKLVEPTSSLGSIKSEDQYGLRCKQYQVNMAPDYAKYSL